MIATLGRLSQLKGSRFVYKVEDLYPDVAVALGTFKKGGIADRFFSQLSDLLLKNADAVVALEERMATILRGRGARRVEVIPNWADGDSIRPDPDAGSNFRQRHDLDDRFVILYSGNHGLAHRFDAVCKAASRLQEDAHDVVFLFVGGGPRREDVKVATKGLNNVRFLPYQPREELNELYNAADIHLVTLRDEVAGLLVPSKYPAALAAGKPVLLVGGSGAEIYSEIENERIGWSIPHRSDEVYRVVTSAVNSRSELDSTARRARSLFDRKYAMGICTDKWRRLLGEVTNITHESTRLDS
jgi:glycosyltransferase involved in cell wall biosynthesis